MSDSKNKEQNQNVTRTVPEYNQVKPEDDNLVIKAKQEAQKKKEAGE
ncbi:hypothetical protein [Selenomonas sp. AB3002]|jgi:hypothetical protein